MQHLIYRSGLLFVMTFLVSLSALFSQTPQKMSYQAVIRNSTNNLVANTQIGMRVSILQGSATGTVVYREIYNPNPQTNLNGLVTVEIGGGVPVLGLLSDINWADGPYFVQIETDPGGGTNYSLVSTSELLSVPFALYAASGNAGPPGSDGLPGATWYTGITDPIGSIGQANDLFLNTTNGNYFKKTEPTVWALLGNLSGPQGLQGDEGPMGLAGTSGATWHTGISDPNGSIGEVNDLYLNTTNGNYFKKTETAVWALQGNLSGPQGPAGAANISGVTNYLVKFTGENTGGISRVYDTGANVGINTTTPMDLLDVKGNVRGYLFRGDVLNDKGTTQPLRLYGNGPVFFGADNNDDDTYTSSNLFVWYNNGELYPHMKMVMSEAGYLGIGTPTPSAQLHTTGTVRFEGLSGTGTRPLVVDATGVVSTASAAGTHYIGENYGGGYVFYVYDEGRHGLICAKSDQSMSMRWSAGVNTNTMARADGMGGGKSNTTLIIASQGLGDGNMYAARLCNEYSVTENGVKYADWYLPSHEELILMSAQRTVIGGFAEDFYWSSTENGQDEAGYLRFSTVQLPILFFKGAVMHVRAIRAF